MKKKLLYILTAALSIAALLTGAEYLKKQHLQRDIAEKIIRFHVIANSDTKEDQSLKLKVRDAVGSKMQELLGEAANREECEAIIKENRQQIEKTAAQIVAEAGYDYNVETCLKEVDFPVKTYGEYTFPAGRYQAFEIVLGEGKGRNWWCVMYPNMCFSGSIYEVVGEDAKTSLEEVLSQEEYQEILTSQNYRVQFKYLSFLNRLSDGNEE